VLDFNIRVKTHNVQADLWHLTSPLVSINCLPVCILTEKVLAISKYYKMKSQRYTAMEYTCFEMCSLWFCISNWLWCLFISDTVLFLPNCSFYRYHHVVRNYVPTYLIKYIVTCHSY
jgi:hypothetical protein